MSVKSRIAKLWAAAAARADTGIKLTGDEALVLHVDDVGAIAKARAEGKIVFVCDEPLPPAGVIL